MNSVTRTVEEMTASEQLYTFYRKILMKLMELDRSRFVTFAFSQRSYFTSNKSTIRCMYR